MARVSLLSLGLDWRKRKLTNRFFRSSHLWINIHAGYYDFQQKERDAAYVLTITKDDMIEFFTKHFFATETKAIRRLSVHLQAQRMQPEILATLGPEFAALGVPVDEAQMMAFVASKPTIPVIKEFAEKVLRGFGKSEEVIGGYLKKVDGLITPTVPEGVILISDVDGFRKAQLPAPYAEPVAEYVSFLTRTESKTDALL